MVLGVRSFVDDDGGQKTIENREIRRAREDL